MTEVLPPAEVLTLDRLPIGQRARIVGVDWTRIAEEEGRRLRALGIDVGAKVAVAHRGLFAGKDPIALRVGRMVVALRRMHAVAMRVEPASEEAGHRHGHGHGHGRGHHHGHHPARQSAQ